MQCHRTLLLGAVLALQACGGKTDRPLAYSAVIDPAFTPVEVEAIAAALDDWNASVPQVHVTYEIGACDAPLPQQLCLHPNYDAPDMADDIVGDTQPVASGGATVILYVSRILASHYDFSALLRQTAAHEVGHVMGLRHSSSGTLMAPYVQEQAPSVASADVAQFWSVSGEPVGETQK
jgi:hypothetical protein